MKKETKNWMLKQLWKDLIGKDSHRGITLTYSWISNQFGHFSLGFIPTILLFYHNKDIYGNSSWIWFAMGVSIIWVLFEIYNLYFPLKSKEFVFSPRWKNLAFDTITDIGFFSLGAFAATLFLSYNIINLIIVILLFFALIYPTRYWYLTKIYQQNAFYPYQLRLCQWEHEIKEEYINLINQYISKKEKGKHLLIIGKRNISNSKLGVCIANELSIQHNTCLYTSAIKLVNIMIERNRNQYIQNNLWNWNSSNYLLIDDVDSQKILDTPVAKSGDSLKIINKLSKSNLDSNLLIKKNIIWVISYDDINGKIAHHPWTKLLVEAGVDSNKIYTVMV